MDTSAVWQAIKSWPREDQIALAFRLWDESIDDGWVPEPSDDVIEELDRRLAAYEADPNKFVTWDQIRAKASQLP